MNFVGVDIGASGTRYTNDSGKFKTVPNNTVFLDSLDIDVGLKPYDDNIESALDVSIVKDGDSDYFPIHALVGAMADRYDGNIVRPSVGVNKHQQKITYLSAILSVALSKLENAGMGEDIWLYLALPPVELSTDKMLATIRNNFVGKYTVKFNKFGTNGTTVTFTISDVICYEESYMAAMSYIFDTDGTYREDAKPYFNGNILSMDIGASTTDLAIIKNGKYINKTGKTIKVGGNIAREYLKNYLIGELGSDIPDQEVDVCITEGRCKIGNSYIDISEEVDEAKHKVAQSIVQKMDGYFGTVDMSINNINVIVVSGGGSMHSQFISDTGETVITTKPMGYYITEALKGYCKGIEVVNYGDNPRIANIKGLYIAANVDIVHKMAIAKGN